MDKKEFIKNWLKTHKFGVIATSVDDKPWAATIDYSVDDDLNIFIGTNPNSLKFQNILKNPNICLVVDSQNEEGTLRLQGIAECLKPTNRTDPSIKIKPKIFIFQKRDKNMKVETIKLEM